MSLLRIPRKLLETIHADLSRPHQFAAERVGFLFCRSSKSNGEWLALAVDYSPVADGDYIRDRRVGARINGSAIRKAMQRALDTDDGVFHVHRHEERGSPWFSPVDLRGLEELLPSFVAVGASTVHGAVVLSRDDASMVWYASSASAPAAGLVSVIGYPLLVRRGRNGF